jgi:hypothetical protein
LAMANPPPQKSIFCRIFMATKRSRFSIPRPIQLKPSHPMVDCGIFEYFDPVYRLNLARQLQFGYGSSTPPPAKIRPKMHFTKQSCRSFARTNSTKPSHPDVDCGIEVEHP